MTETERIAERIASTLPHGSLQIWGYFFGRPYDLVHHIVQCQAEQDVLQLVFKEGESLSVWCPRKVIVSEDELKIMNAARVRWEWFLRLPKIPTNRYYEDYTKTADGIVAATNFNRSSPYPILRPPSQEPAIVLDQGLRKQRRLRDSLLRLVGRAR